MKMQISAPQRESIVKAGFSPAQCGGIARDAKSPEIFAYIAANAAAIKEKFGASIDSRVRHFNSVEDVQAALDAAPTPAAATAPTR